MHFTGDRHIWAGSTGTTAGSFDATRIPIIGSDASKIAALFWLKHGDRRLRGISISALASRYAALIAAANASQYGRFLPPAGDLALKYGLTMRIVPSKRLDWSARFTSETEKYSGQVGLDKDDYITNYVAGMPFPTVSTSDPKAALKIAYNWHMGPFMPDDFSLEPWGSFAYSGTEPNSFVPEEQNNYECSRMVFLRYAHRTEVEPRHTLGANEDGVEWKLRCMEWQGAGVGKTTGAVVRYLDPRKPDGSIWFHGRTTGYLPRGISDTLGMGPP